MIERSRWSPSEYSPDGELGRVRKGDDGPGQKYTRGSDRIAAVHEVALPSCSRPILGVIMDLSLILEQWAVQGHLRRIC